MTGYQSKKTAALDEDGMYLVHQTASYADNLGKSIVALGKQTVKDIEQLKTQPEQEPESCNGRNCAASIKNDFEHSNECIVDTAKEQRWSHAPEAKKAAIALNGVLAQPSQELTLQEQLVIAKAASDKAEGSIYADYYKAGAAVQRLQAALAQPAQEPVAYDKTEMNGFVQDLYDKKMQEGKHGHYETMFHVVHQAIKRVSPQRTWVDLTEDQIKVIEEKALTKEWAIRMTIAQLKECNI
jgi:hypothetical protein